MKSLFILDVSSAIDELLVILLWLNVVSLLATVLSFPLCTRLKYTGLLKAVILIVATLSPVIISHLVFSVPRELNNFTVFSAIIFSLIFATVKVVVSGFRFLFGSNKQKPDGM